jgi:hypothetical protein
MEVSLQFSGNGGGAAHDAVYRDVTEALSGSEHTAGPQLTQNISFFGIVPAEPG